MYISTPYSQHLRDPITPVSITVGKPSELKTQSATSDRVCEHSWIKSLSVLYWHSCTCVSWPTHLVVGVVAGVVSCYQDHKLLCESCQKETQSQGRHKCGTELECWTTSCSCSSSSSNPEKGPNLSCGPIADWHRRSRRLSKHGRTNEHEAAWSTKSDSGAGCCVQTCPLTIPVRHYLLTFCRHLQPNSGKTETSGVISAVCGRKQVTETSQLCMFHRDGLDKTHPRISSWVIWVISLHAC